LMYGRTANMATKSTPAPVVDVVHEVVDGWHRFTSPQVPGLYIIVGANDYVAGLNDVPHAIELLIEGDYGRKVAVKQTGTFAAYTDRMPADMRPTIFHYVIEPAA